MTSLELKNISLTLSKDESILQSFSEVYYLLKMSNGDNIFSSTYNRFGVDIKFSKEESIIVNGNSQSIPICFFSYDVKNLNSNQLIQATSQIQSSSTTSEVIMENKVIGQVQYTFSLQQQKQEGKSQVLKKTKKCNVTKGCNKITRSISSNHESIKIYPISLIENSSNKRHSLHSNTIQIKSQSPATTSNLNQRELKPKNSSLKPNFQMEVKIQNDVKKLLLEKLQSQNKMPFSSSNREIADKKVNKISKGISPLPNGFFPISSKRIQQNKQGKKNKDEPSSNQEATNLSKKIDSNPSSHLEFSKNEENSLKKDILQNVIIERDPEPYQKCKSTEDISKFLDVNGHSNKNLFTLSSKNSTTNSSLQGGEILPLNRASSLKKFVPFYEDQTLTNCQKGCQISQITSAPLTQQNLNQIQIRPRLYTASTPNQIQMFFPQNNQIQNNLRSSSPSQIYIRGGQVNQSNFLLQQQFYQSGPDRKVPLFSPKIQFINPEQKIGLF